MTATRYFCPLDCGWHYDRPGFDPTDPDRLYPVADIPAPGGVDPIAFSFAAGELQTVEAAVKQHLDTHELIEWVQVVGRLKDERTRLAVRVAELEQQAASRYAEQVNAPLHPDTINALNERLTAGDYPVRKVTRTCVACPHCGLTKDGDCAC